MLDSYREQAKLGDPADSDCEWLTDSRTGRAAEELHSDLTFLNECIEAGYYSLAVLFLLGWPGSLVIAFVFAAIKTIYSRKPGLTTLGSARWADEGDLRAAGMVGATSGLVLGRLPKHLRRGQDHIRLLFDLRGVSAERACRQFWSEV